MTTRDQARRATDVRADERGGVRPEPSPSLPERLFAARERKGVDLYRAERDTKIRARYLAALERGDYKELPGAVYTKGFLRNYALYLGLDPEEVLLEWRHERGDAREVAPLLAVPQPLAAPRAGLNFSPGVIVAALMTVGVVVFIAYVGMQLLRYNKPPTIAVTNPSTALLTVDESTTSYVLRGRSTAGATISVTTPGRDQPYRVSADADGAWSAEVELRRGRNQFEVNAVDPETGKPAETPARLVITVPFEVIQAPTLAVDQPADGATFENGAIPVQGATTNASKVVVAAEYVGPAPGQGAPPPSAAPGASGQPAQPGPRPPAPLTVEIREDGTFQAPFELTSGQWRLTISASSNQGKTTSLTRTVTVAYKGVNLVVTLTGRAWIKVWVDGTVDQGVGQAGSIFDKGKTLTFTGQRSIEIRTGSSGVTQFTLNGTPLGALGRSGTPETWLFEPPGAPQKTQRR